MKHTMADRLKARTRQFGLNVGQVAEMAGINRSFVYDIMRGRSENPNLEKLGKVAAAIKVERNWLLHGMGGVEGESLPSLQVYILHDGMGLVAKRLENIPNNDPPMVRVISDNNFYSPYECTLDEVNIIGKVRWYAREI